MVLMISLFFPIYTKIQTWDLFPSEMPLWLLSDAFNNIQRLGFHAAKFSARKKAEKRSVRAHCKASETRFALAAATKLHCLSP